MNRRKFIKNIAFSSVPIPFGFWKPSSGPVLTVTSGLLGQWESTAITGLNDGDSVSSWPDLSGNSRTATAAGGNRPVYKTSLFGTKPAVRFNESPATAHKMDFTGTDISGAFTCFIVMIPRNGGGVYHHAPISYLDSTGSHNGFMINSSSGNSADGSTKYTPHITVRHSGSETINKIINSAINVGSKYIQTWTYNGTTPTCRINGSAQTFTDADSGYGTTNGLIGWAFTYHVGDIAAILVYDNVLSAGDITTVETYLNTKYPSF